MSTHRAYLGVLAGAVLATVAGLPRFASANEMTVAVLGVEAGENTPDTLASAITDSLRQRVTASKGFRLVPGRDLVEVKLVFSCPDEAPSCMAQAAKSLGAAKLIFGNVKKSVGDNFVVTLKLLDTARGSIDGITGDQITRAQATPAGVRGPVASWFARLTGQAGGVGIVRVRGDVIGAMVTLDGAPSGIIGTEELVIPGVSPGRHEVVVNKAGYDPVRREVNVVAGETADVDARMARTAPVAATTPPVGAAPGAVDAPSPVTSTRDEGDGDSRAALKTATWLVLGAGLVGVALGVKFGLDVDKVNEDLDPYRRFMCTGSPYGCDGNGRRHTAPITQMEVDIINDRKSDGERFETLQWISYGVGGALIVTSGFLFYRAYLREDDQSARTSGRGFTLLPALSPTSAGFVAVTRF